MQKEENDTLITDNKKLQKLKNILNLFDGAAKLTLKKLSPEDLDLLVAWSINNRLGALGRSPSSSPSIALSKGINAKEKTN
jgi:hypothetical protein